MKYRKMGSLDWEVSALGFGCMRLPTSGLFKKADENYSIEIIREGIDLGINYLDTAWTYHNGFSEKILGNALKDGYREKVHVATKLPTFLVNTEQDFDRFLNSQLERLQLDYIDIYMFHCLNKFEFKKIKRLNLIDKMEKARDEGKIKHIGFSFHDIFPVLKQIVDYYNWDTGQIQYNYMDTGIQATTDGLKYLHEKGITVVIMEPLKGGLLVNPTKEVSRILEKAENQRTPVDWALQFLWDRPEVSVVLSGMNSRQQVVDNCESADRSGVNSLTQNDRITIQKITKVFKRGILVPCTGCGYCEPCPAGVSIPTNFGMMNNMVAGGNSIPDKLFRRQIQRDYRRLAQSKEERERTGKEGSSLLCIGCGTCIPKCPQSINIPEELKKVNDIIGEEKRSIRDIFQTMLYVIRNWRTFIHYLWNRI